MKRINSIPAHDCAEDIEQLLIDLSEYFDGRADADDEGPNESMKFLIRIDQQLAKMEDATLAKKIKMHAFDMAKKLDEGLAMKNNVKDISETDEGKAAIALYNIVSQKFLS